MAHLTDVMNLAGTVTFGPISGHGPGFTSPLINIPPPGESEIGGVSGIINEIFRRIPLPRPRLPRLPPGPKGPGGGGPGRFPFPFPIPFPVPGGDIFGGGAPDCPEDVCCRGQHPRKDKTQPFKCVSNRRMNSLNPRALRRAIRRLSSFESFVVRSRKSLRKLSKI